MMRQETIRLEHLDIGYRDKRSVKTVATDISAAIRQGELTCLLGANGVGKSTLLRTLSAFQPKLGGSIFINGRELSDDSERSRLIGVVLTENPSVQNMTARELVALGRSPYTDFWGRLREEDQRIVSEAMEQVGISPLTSRLVDTLSDGERQKVMIAKALAQQTPVIFLDEPTAFLDYPSKVEVLQLLRRISREAEKTIFLSTHDVELALQLADTIWLMRKVEERGKRKEERDMTKHEEEGRRPVTIGSPEELAASGDLGLFIERQNIVFDKETLTIKVKK